LNRYRGLQAFFKWAVAEGELEASPMASMNPPQIPDEPPAMLTDELRRLLLALAIELRAFRVVDVGPLETRHRFRLVFPPGFALLIAAAESLRPRLAGPRSRTTVAPG